ncbi:MAG: hypothetical protein WC285_03960 [Candidatus Gracilibacteria bacterium]
MAKEILRGEEEYAQGDGGVGLTALKLALRAAEQGLGFDRMVKAGQLQGSHLIGPEVRRRLESILRVATVDRAEMSYVDKLLDPRFVGDRYIGGDNGYISAICNLRVGEKPLYDIRRPREGDVSPPTLEQVKEIFAENMTLEQLEVVKGMVEPSFQLIPITSMARYFEAFDGYEPNRGYRPLKVYDRNGKNREYSRSSRDYYQAYFREEKVFQRADERDGVANKNTIIGWRIAITQGGFTRLVDDNPAKTFRERLDWFKREFGRKGVSGIDLKGALLLGLNGISREYRCIYRDSNIYWTFINGEPERNGRILCAGWDEEFREIVMRERDVGDISRDEIIDYYSRKVPVFFRPSVVFDVPKI